MAIQIEIVGSPTNGSNPWLNSLVWGGAWGQDPTSGSTTGPAVISYSAMSGTDPYGFFASQTMGWSSSDLAALEKALGAWEAVANITFVQAGTSDDADVWLWKVTDVQSEVEGEPVLGWSEVPSTDGTIEPLYTCRERTKRDLDDCKARAGGQWLCEPDPRTRPPPRPRTSP
jgi:hypothetical protein